MSGPSFRFRLERVRALRERSEDAAKQELAGAMVRHRDCAEQLREADAVMERAREQQLAVGTARASAIDLLDRQAYLERTERERAHHEQELAQREREVAGRREALTLAARERQTLERLKEQRRADHERESARLESLALDEIAINGFRRSAA
jgi:flagellar FliJ protein